jgi:kanamycin kinase
MPVTVAAREIRCPAVPGLGENGRMISQQPAGPRHPPRVLDRLAAGRPTKSVWRNDLGGLTFQIGAGQGTDREFLKWVPHGIGVDLGEEVARLEWATRYTRAPRVLDRGEDEQGSWFLSAGLPGRTAVDDVWKLDPATAVRAIGAGLRALHEELPVADCPFDWGVGTRMAQARANVAAGRRERYRLHEDIKAITRNGEHALELLGDAPEVDRLVVCHGDACAPNTLIGEDGACSAHVDFDALGVADRWADLAIATWSTTWNYGPGWEEPLLEAYGVAPDAERTRYYRLLWSFAD